MPEMPSSFHNSLGTLAEGTLSLKDGVWILVDSEGEEHQLDDILKPWENRRVRFNIANLELLESLVEAGMVPGHEVEFVNNLTDEQVENIINGDNK